MQCMNQALTLSENLKLANRVVLAPMASETADEQGFVTAQTLAHYQRLAQAQTGLIMLEYTFVHRSGRSELNQLGIDSDQHIEGLKKLVRLLHTEGAKVSLQLTHAGAKGERSLSQGRLIAPSGIKVPVKDRELETPDVASLDDISMIQQAFVAAAKRASLAGLDMVELHAAHGYGLNQWLSPLTNQRLDQYGGSLKNRARILLEIIAEIRLELPYLPISVRIPGQDHAPGGLDTQAAIDLSQLLECAGVSLINVSSGIGGWKRPKARIGEGYLVEDAQLIQAQLKLPVVGVGGIQSAEFINQSLCRKSFALAAVGRAILANPDWGIQVGLRR